MLNRVGFSFVSLVFIFGLLSGCAHHRDVRPGADGLHRVTVRAEEREGAERSAISQAEHYCESINKRYAIVKEETKYTGSMDEGTRNTLKRASQAASVVGNNSTMAQRHREFQQGGPIHVGPSTPGENPIGTAGTIGAIMTGGQDYVTEMQFRCE